MKFEGQKVINLQSEYSYPVFLVLPVGDDEVGGALPGERLGLRGRLADVVHPVLGGVGRLREDRVAAVLQVVLHPADVQPRRRPHVAGLPVPPGPHLVGGALRALPNRYHQSPAYSVMLQYPFIGLATTINTFGHYKQMSLTSMMAFG